MVLYNDLWCRIEERFDGPNGLDDKLIQYIYSEYMYYQHNASKTHIDAGCHALRHTVPMAIKCQPYGKVYAFDPYRSVVEENMYKLDDYGIDNVEYYPVALSNFSGIADFTKFVGAHRGHSSLTPNENKMGRPGYKDYMVTNATVTTLDEFLSPEEVIGFMKFDLEGSDLLALKGAVETIKNNHPVIVIEKSHRVSTRRELLDFADDIDYAVLSTDGREYNQQMVCNDLVLFHRSYNIEPWSLELRTVFSIEAKKMLGITDD